MKQKLQALGAGLGWVLLLMVLQMAMALLLPGSVSLASICADCLFVLLLVGWLLFRKQPVRSMSFGSNCHCEEQRDVAIRNSLRNDRTLLGSMTSPFRQVLALHPISVGTGLSALLLGLGLMPLFLLTLMLLPLPEQWLTAYESAVSPLQHEPIALLFVLSVLVAPVTEEALVRGVIYSRLRAAFPRPWAAVCSAVVFGALHGELLWAVLAGLFGLLLVWARERSGSLWPCVLLHMGYNGCNFLPEGLFSPLGLAICTTTALLAGRWFIHCTKVQKSTLTEPPSSANMSL